MRVVREHTLRITLPGCYPLLLTWTGRYWRRNGTRHGPKSNPWLVALTWIRLGVHEPSSARRLWVYLRGGYAWCADAYIDRRPVAR